MERHYFRAEPLHNIVGRHSDTHPEMEELCGHVDLGEQAVCLLNAVEHHNLEEDERLSRREDREAFKGLIYHGDPPAADLKAPHKAG